MKFNYHYVLFLIFIFSKNIKIIFGLSEIEAILTKNLIEHFRIKHCILVTSDDEQKISIFKDFKLLSEWNTVCAVKTEKQLKNYIFELDPFLDSSVYGTNNEMWESTAKLLMPKTLVLFQKTGLKFFSRLFTFSSSRQTSNYFTWTIFLKETFNPRAYVPVPSYTEVIFVEKTNSTSYKLTEVYSVAQWMFKKEYGVWDTDTGLRTAELSIYERRKNFNQTMIMVNGVLRGRRVFDATLYSYHFEILELFADMLNFKFELGKTLIKFRSSIITDLLYDMNADHYVNVDIGPIFKINSYLFIEEPAIVPNSTYYLLPFDANLWRSFFYTVLLMTALNILIYVTLEHQLKTETVDLVDSLFAAFEIFCIQFGSTEAKIASYRIIIYISRLLSLILLGSYSAELFTYLLLRTPRTPFEGLDGLVAGNSYNVGCAFRSYNYFRFALKSSEFGNEIYEKWIKGNIVNDTAAGLDRACQEKFAYITSPHEVYNNSADCKIFQIKKPVLVMLTSIKLDEDAVGLKKFFFYKLHWLYHSGILHRLQKHLNSIKLEKLEEEYLPVEMGHISRMLLIIFGGIGISAILLVLEKIWEKTEVPTLEQQYPIFTAELWSPIF